MRSVCSIQLPSHKDLEPQSPVGQRAGASAHIDDSAALDARHYDGVGVPLLAAPEAAPRPGFSEAKAQARFRIATLSEVCKTKW